MWTAEAKYRALVHGNSYCFIHWLHEMNANKARPIRPDPCRLEILPNRRGGSTNIALELTKSHPTSRIGLVIAGNSGRPGGACGHMDRYGRPYVDSLHHHSTQEEDVVSNWLLTHKHVEDTDPNTLFANTIGGKRRWGMTYPDWSRLDPHFHLLDHTSKTWSPIKDPTVVKALTTLVKHGLQQVTYSFKGFAYEAQLVSGDASLVLQTNQKTHTERKIRIIIPHMFDTIQGKDYRMETTANYQDAWYVSNCLVCEKTKTGYNFDNRTRCSLVFVAGPLATGDHSLHPPASQGDYASTQHRTFSQHAKEDYTFFIQSVEKTFYAALLAMALKGDTIAVLCHVSGGIYAGEWRSSYGDKARNLDELTNVVNRVLNRRLSDVPLGCYFEKVVFSTYMSP